MCGIAGFFDGARNNWLSRDRDYAWEMAERLRHRGPDAGEVWMDKEAGVAFGHRRLCVVDLTPTGRQPMASASNRSIIAYNGEVYNNGELRAELEAAGVHFRGTSDTEVVVEACERWGVEAAAKRFIGMFAFALWDRESRTLSLVRDRIGIKPLYWGEFDGTILFASELKALRAHPAFDGTIDRKALVAFLRYGYVPAPLSIYERVRKVGPGSIVTLRAGADPTEARFWSLNEVARQGLAARSARLSDDEALEQLHALLLDAVGRRMIADVPLGAFLSGGIDSSTVVALMQTQSLRPVRTFSIGFGDRRYNEATHARAVAAHLHTEHTEFYVEASDVFDVVPRLPEIYDEPFADSSQIPTALLSELTRRYVTVALSGDGGDEVFAGYNRYLLAGSLPGWTRRVPSSMRAGLSRAITAFSPAAWDTALTLAPRALRRPLMGEKLHKLSRILTADDADEMYRRLVSLWPDPAALVVGGSDPSVHNAAGAVADGISGAVDRMQYLDMLTYLPDDILTKVDRASMAFSLEARVPLLDHRVVEFAWTLPMRFRIRNGRSKWLLRDVLRKYVPERLTDRPKMGFGVPLDAWLRGPLREWAESLLDDHRLAEDGYLRPGPIRRRWEEHQSGARNWQDSLWSVLMFQAWLETERTSQVPAAP